MTSSLTSRLHAYPYAVQSLIALTLVITFAANLYGLTAGVSIVLPHLFYIPIILAAFFFPRRGIAFAVVVSAGYLLMVLGVSPGVNPDFLSAAARCIVFVIIAAVVSYLSERVYVRETELMQAKDEWELTFNAVPDLIALISSDHHILRVNRAMADRLGMSLGQAVGLRCYEVVHHSSAPPLQCPHAMLLRDGKVHSEEIHEDGLGGDFLVTTSPIYGKDGTLIASVHIARDITERKRIETALRDSEAKFRAVIDQTFQFIGLMDTDGTLIEANRSSLAFAGITESDVINRPFWETPWWSHSKELQEKLKEAIRRAATGETVRFEATHPAADGHLAYIDFSVKPVVNDEGRILYLIPEGRDITERKQIETALRQSEEKYRAIINEMQDIFYRTDLGGKITMLSPSAARLSGYDSTDQILGQDVSVVYADPADRDGLLAALTAKGSVYAYPLNLKVRDGTIRHVTTSSHFYRDAAGNIQGVEGVIHDITEQRRAEAALRESEERYRSIIENIQDVYFRFDRESRLVMTSPSASRMFGYPSVTEMLGLPASSLWKDPKAREKMIDTMRKQGGVVQDWEAEFIKRDGSVFWGSISGHMHTDQYGEYAGKEGIIRDITERRKTAEALKEALKKLNMLSSITRHDILNQITGLRTYLELSREDLKGTRFAAFIDKEDQAAEAIQRQIEFTKFYQDIGVNAPRWQDVAAVISEAVAQLNPPAIDVQIRVTGVEIFADPLIEKVFYNLMENSLRHGERVTEMSFSSRESETGLVLTYRDNGVGISAEDKKRLFQKGFGKHTGLGLFLSREILAITGITITENGEPGAGVRFEITVPKEGYRYTS